jgi:hypothetical protein
MFFDNHTYLFDCAIELIKADSSTIVNVKEFEAFSEVTLFSLRLRAFLSNLCPQFGFKTIDHQGRITYFLITLFIFK